MRYIKQLDSFRAIAVLMVIVFHWLPNDFGSLPLGPIGVDIFFTLSGFLITRILLHNRRHGQGGKLRLIQNFVIRRTLRIFPIYYITIFLMALLLPFIREHFSFYLTYTTNFLFISSGQLKDSGSHVWSLAVEEQFYLFWPWLMIYIPEKYLLRVILAAIGTGIVSGMIFSSIFTLSCFNAFGIGGLLAYVYTNKTGYLYSLRNWSKWVSTISLFALLPIIYFDQYYALGRTFTAAAMLFPFVYAMEQRKNVILDSPILIFLGKISYGLYLFHNFIPNIWAFFFGYSFNYPVIMTAVKFMILVGISTVSWYLIESPLNNLKRFFTYKENVPDAWLFEQKKPAKVLELEPKK